MSDGWDAQKYHAFYNERIQAAIDLLARIRLKDPTSVVDLGCGSATSTQLLVNRWHNAKITGLDSSGKMLAAARNAVFNAQFIEMDLMEWEPKETFDLVFSNATFQWVKDHQMLLKKVSGLVNDRGVLAFQIPSAKFPRVRELIQEVSHDSAWDDLMAGPRSRLTMYPPSYYYDLLAQDFSKIDLWETDYLHVLDSKEQIVQWVAATGLRPYLEVLDGAGKERFLAILRARIDDSYPVQADGKVLFSFTRTFCIASR